MSQLNTQKLTIVLTSRENFIWASMQEIIPQLELCWLGTASKSHQVRVINVDQAALKDIVKLALVADNIVITCFNLKLAKIFNLIRSKMSIATRIIFHLHNQATIALWPLKSFGMLDFFNSEDIFISSCSRDLNTLQLSVKNAKCFVAPFTLEKDDLLSMIKRRGQSFDKKLYYVGRISRQKNIHLIIEAIKLLKNDGINIEFDIYGEEDCLGSPNMGISDFTYCDELVALIDNYGLKNSIHLKGHVQRDILYLNALDKRQIFITASSHSDENFGMALFRGLLKGDLCIMSDWGGHFDFLKIFRNQIFYFGIYPKDEAGLTANIIDIKMKILEALNSSATLEDEKDILDTYSEEKISEIFSRIISLPLNHAMPMSFTDLFENVNQARVTYKNHPTKVFNDYNDPNAIEFFKSYGLRYE